MPAEYVNENTAKIYNYSLSEKLSNPFVFNDGSFVKTKEDWERRRKELYKTTVEFQYGTMPPEPEFLEVEPVCYGTVQIFRIITGTRKNPITFYIHIFKACKSGKDAPAVISGDLCFSRVYNKDWIEAITGNDINLVLFNRTELAPDLSQCHLDILNTTETGEYKLGKEVWDKMLEGDCGGQVKRAYPEYTFRALGAWAWGYSRVVDALEVLGCVNTDCIAFTGHSRGGKTAALAGAIDERAKIVNANATCQGAYSGYRINADTETEDGTLEGSERLSNIYRQFPAWMGPEMDEYINCGEKVPFDSHEFKAMIAPRVLYVSEAAHDGAANPVGSYQTTEAAGEVFRFLGVPQNLIWYFREGAHNQTVGDMEQLANVVNHVFRGEELNEKFFKLPFKKLPKAYNWQCPVE